MAMAGCTLLDAATFGLAAARVGRARAALGRGLLQTGPELPRIPTAVSDPRAAGGGPDWRQRR